MITPESFLKLLTGIFAFVQSNPMAILVLITIGLTGTCKKNFRAGSTLNRSWPVVVSIGVSFFYMLVKNEPLHIKPPGGFILIAGAIWQYGINVIWMGLQVAAWSYLVHNLVIKNYFTKKAS